MSPFEEESPPLEELELEWVGAQLDKRRRSAE